VVKKSAVAHCIIQKNIPDLTYLPSSTPACKQRCTCRKAAWYIPSIAVSPHQPPGLLNCCRVYRCRSTDRESTLCQNFLLPPGKRTRSPLWPRISLRPATLSTPGNDGRTGRDFKTAEGTHCVHPGGWSEILISIRDIASARQNQP
jgi:hypothetical protein